MVIAGRVPAEARPAARASSIGSATVCHGRHTACLSCSLATMRRSLARASPGRGRPASHRCIWGCFGTPPCRCAPPRSRRRCLAECARIELVHGRDDNGAGGPFRSHRVIRAGRRAGRQLDDVARLKARDARRVVHVACHGGGAGRPEEAGEGHARELRVEDHFVGGEKALHRAVEDLLVDGDGSGRLNGRRRCGVLGGGGQSGREKYRDRKPTSALPRAAFMPPEPSQESRASTP